MLDRQRLEYGQTIVSHILILHRAAYQHIVIPIAPIFGNAIHEAVNAFGEEIEPQVAPLLHHQPALLAPLVSVGEQEVGSEAGENYLAALDFPRLVALSLNGKIETSCLSAQAARHLTAVHLVLTIHIAVFAPRTDLGASMPRIPVRVDVFLLCHNLYLTFLLVSIS